MGTLVEFKLLGNEESGYAEGFTAGQSARDRGLELTPYHEVGIDDYAKGFRAAFFNQLDLTGTWGGR
jgi:hypothetical protein